LRTPLAVIQTTTELVMAQPGAERQDARAPVAHRARGQAVDELIAALLLLSRSERQGPQDGEATDVSKWRPGGRVAAPADRAESRRR
jgi:signal transduction histidine kinase